MNYRERFKQIKSILLGIDPGFSAVYYRYFYQVKTDSIGSIVEKHFADIRPFYFLQVGGNDGYMNDPIFKCVKRYPHWKGIIVEPQKEVFQQRLSKTYRSERKVTLENVAIADETGVKHLHKIAFSQSRWATGLASFNRATLEAEIKRGYVDEQAKREGIIPPTNLEDYFTTEPVDCTTISDLLVKHQFPQLDLLQIDTEGYDFEIIKTVDFTQFKPKIISFEHQHLSPKDTIACQTLLDKQGYTILKKGRDSIAYSTVGR